MGYLKRLVGIAVLLSVLMLVGCSAQAPSSQSSSQNEPTAAEQSSQPAPTKEQTKEANWVIEINDSQQVTDADGLVWNYKLSMYASKTGGNDVLGNYTGEIVLNMEPDLDSAKALAAREGAQLLAMLFEHRSEAQNVSFEVMEHDADQYAKLMKQAMPDDPLLQFDPTTTIDCFAITNVTFQATQKPIQMTISDDEGAISGSVPGRTVTVTVPMELTIEGATVYCHIYETVHPVGAFKGVITGDVIS